MGSALGPGVVIKASSLLSLKLEYLLIRLPIESSGILLDTKAVDWLIYHVIISVVQKRTEVAGVERAPCKDAAPKLSYRPCYGI